MSDLGVRHFFEWIEPRDVRVPFVINSPHSGDRYDPAFLTQTRLTRHELRRTADLFVDELFIGLVREGAPLLRAHVPRTYVDLNREPYELDPRLFEGRLPPFANTRSLRVAGGLGTLARVVGDAQEIYPRRLSLHEGLGRIERYYHPYHAALRRRLDAVRHRFGVAVLIDCHSMPSSSLGADGRRAADIVLGDRYGTSCASELSDRIELAARRSGFSVQRNHPYAGGFITEHYGHSALGFHAVQIEVNRALYMDEDRLAPRNDFAEIAARMTQLVAEAFEFGRTRLHFPQAAAE